MRLDKAVEMAEVKRQIEQRIREELVAGIEALTAQLGQWKKKDEDKDSKGMLGRLWPIR